jgi:PAS domain S-box-containing protein
VFIFLEKLMAEHYLKRELYARVAENNAIFEFLQGGSLDGIWYWDLENPKHEWMSPRFWETLGYDPLEKEHLSSEWQDLIHPDDLELALDNFNKHFSDPNHPFDQVVRYRHNDGSTVWVRCRGLMIRDDDGKPVRMLGAHSELTALKRSEEQLVQSNSELEAFSYSVSHDLRAPLRRMNGFSRALMQGHADKLDDEGRHYLERICAGAEQMGRLIDSLLDLSRITQHQLSPGCVDVRAILLQIAAELRATESERDVEFIWPNEAVVVGDEKLLRVALQNLIGNAWKFTARLKKPARIEFGMSRNAECASPNADLRDDVLVYFVRDNGAGFDMAYESQLFGVFQRLHREDEFEGTGIGLTTVQRIIRKHGGRIWAEGLPGKGATFYFMLQE